MDNQERWIMTKNPWQKMRLEIDNLREIISRLSNEELESLKDQGLSESAQKEVEKILDSRKIASDLRL